MKRALISGISGQDGAYLAKLLLQKGYEVVGTSRDERRSFPNLNSLGIRERVTIETMALTDFRSVIQTIIKVEPDEVYNLAGQSSVGLSFQQPVETLESMAIGTLNLLESIRLLKKSIRFYNACSSECFGDTRGAVADETTPFLPRSPYGIAKATSYWTIANYREAYGLYACSGILFNHESPLRPQQFVTRKIVSAACRIARGSEMRLQLGNLSIERDWGWAPEYVDAMWRMLQQGEPKDYVIATGESFPLEQFVDTAFASVGLHWKDHVDIDPALFRPTDIAHSRGNPERAKTELGWSALFKTREVAQRMVESELGAMTKAAIEPSITSPTRVFPNQ